ncbi:hypothetical protein QVD17_09947 [Tagetes erecta]|uniref:Uncharacterized protein n=1 Tax=Tagetes erecta TaxID=13708 RepID=A0AAD8L5K6_TARER|nr:hypothetical protein QVD17_09947 [Tagetes erecta]
MYYVHPHCATQVRIQEDLPTDVDHHNVVHFPVSDESNILSHLIKGKTCGDENAHKIEHFTCAPLILKSEQGVNSNQHLEGVYKFLNFKPRLYTRIKHFHEHSNMLLVPGTENDGLCARLFKIHDSLQQDRVKNDRPQKDLKFYPSEMMRPETRHWEQDGLTSGLRLDKKKRIKKKGSEMEKGGRELGFDGWSLGRD